MCFIAQARFVSCAHPRAKTLRRGIMLNYVIVPIDDPQSPVRTDLSANWTGPFIIAGGEVSRIVSDKIRAARFEKKSAEKMPGRLSDKLRPVPILTRKIARGVNGTASPSRVAPVIIDLPHLAGNRIKALAVGN